MSLDFSKIGKIFNSGKSFELSIGDIVNVPVGRGWRKAKIIAKKDGGVLKVKLKTGEVMEIKSEEIMTADETKNFKKSGGNTRIVRNDNGDSLTDMTGETSESPDKKVFGVL